jgi:hypothetical protein
MVTMVGTKIRQWYRMSVAEALRELEVDPSSGVTNIVNRQKIQPNFIQKESWQLYKYSVLRNSTHKKVTIDKLVVGDIVALHTGDIVPADVRLLTAKSLSVLEDSITGSAAPAHKYTFASKALLPKTEQKNMLFAGSEILSGVAVGLVVHAGNGRGDKITSARARRLQKSGFIVQSQSVKKVLPMVVCVVFDDLQQDQEILRLVQKLYLEKSITSIFFIKNSIASHIKKHLPENSIHTSINHKAYGGVSLYVDISEVQKSQILLACKRQGDVVMYVHRGSERGLLPKIADVNLVISSTASQATLFQADLVAPKISISTLASILHNKK